jgi:hypothetical protein
MPATPLARQDHIDQSSALKSLVEEPAPGWLVTITLKQAAILPETK